LAENNVENYLFLFFDSLISAVILPIRTEMAVHVMSISGLYNNYLIFIIASISSILGSIINWEIGQKLIFLQKTKILIKYKTQIKEAEIKWNKYVIWMLLFSSLKILGNPLSLLAGFLRSTFKKFLVIIVIGKVIYYFHLIFLYI